MTRAVRVGLVQHLAGVVIDDDLGIGGVIIRTVQESMVALVDALLRFGLLTALALPSRSALGGDITECGQRNGGPHENAKVTVNTDAPASTGGKNPWHH